MPGLFAPAGELFGSVVAWLGGPVAGALDHAGLEERLVADARELGPLLLQAHLDLRAAREERRAAVTGPDGITRIRAESGHQRCLATLAGQVRVTRIAYRAPGLDPNVHLADAALSLPAGRHSHGLQRLAAIEATRGSFCGRRGGDIGRAAVFLAWEAPGRRARPGSRG